MAGVQMQVHQREEISLTIQPRDERGTGQVRRLRREQGMLPGVVYGHRQEAYAFKVEARPLQRALSRGGQNAIFMLQHSGNGDQVERVVVKDIQYHKVLEDIIHVDFLRVDPAEQLRLEVPIVTIGLPVGVRVGGGAVQHSLPRVEMTCVASELPSELEIDISELEIGDSIHVRDLLDQDDRIVTDPGVTIVSVLAPRLTIDEELELAQAEAEEGEELLEGEEGVEGEEGAEGEGEGDQAGAPAEES